MNKKNIRLKKNYFNFEIFDFTPLTKKISMANNVILYAVLYEATFMQIFF